jgi:glycosyltransferase involved in cell wall biosynthesis
MSPILSLVVPVYNVAPFLETCLESLVAQDPAGLEIIIVDDGSTDDCPLILARYAAAYPELLRVVRQENGGLSAARNTGLDLATGEYVAFVDSDDWIDPAYYRRLLNLAIEQKLDMAHGNAVFHFEGRREDHPIYLDALATGVMPGKEVLRQRLAQGNFLHMVWMHLYRRDFIEQMHLRFVPRLIHEDVLWSTQVFLRAQRVAYDPQPGYFYRQRVRPLPAEQMDRRLKEVIASSVTNAAGLEVLAREVADDRQLNALIRWQLVDGGMSVFHKLKKISDKAIKAAIYQDIEQRGFFPMLWRNAVDFSQRRRIARNWLKKLFH